MASVRRRAEILSPPDYLGVHEARELPSSAVRRREVLRAGIKIMQKPRGESCRFLRTVSVARRFHRLAAKLLVFPVAAAFIGELCERAELFVKAETLHREKRVYSVGENREVHDLPVIASSALREVLPLFKAVEQERRVRRNRDIVAPVPDSVRLKHRFAAHYEQDVVEHALVKLLEVLRFSEVGEVGDLLVSELFKRRIQSPLDGFQRIDVSAGVLVNVVDREPPAAAYRVVAGVGKRYSALQQPRNVGVVIDIEHDALLAEYRRADEPQVFFRRLRAKAAGDLREHTVKLGMRLDEHFCDLVEELVSVVIAAADCQGVFVFVVGVALHLPAAVDVRIPDQYKAADEVVNLLALHSARDVGFIERRQKLVCPSEGVEADAFD